MARKRLRQVKADLTVLSIFSPFVSFLGYLPETQSAESFTEPFTKPGLFLSIPCWITLRNLANLSIFSICFFRSWRTSFHSSAPEEAIHSTFPKTSLSLLLSMKHFTSASCVEERVGIVGNGCTLGPKTYPSFLRPNLRLASPGIHGKTRLSRSNTGSDTCV